MSEGKEEIMEATYKTLTAYGYADLSIQKIADELGRGKSFIYYHFDDKEDLMTSFLGYMGSQVRDDLEEIKETPREERIDSVIDLILGIEDQEKWKFQKALQEFKTQAQHSEKFREKFREIDRMFIDEFEDLMRESGAENPEAAAEMFMSLMQGAISRKIVTGRRDELEELKNDIKKAVSGFSDKCI